jgi:hypothetical protein
MGRRSPRRAPDEELERMLGLFRDKYADFTVKHSRLDSQSTISTRCRENSEISAHQPDAHALQLATGS